MSTTNTNGEGERRRFTRIPIDCHAIIQCGEQRLESQLLDISLKGALLTRPTTYPDSWCGDTILKLQLHPSNITIIMHGEIIHNKGAQLGFYCKQIDLDSISHLKRMVELNLGGTAALERELGELVDTS